jgi:hypothetical protein
MMDQAAHAKFEKDQPVSGKFLSIAGERYYAIRNVDRMAPFFISVISCSDHWLFVSSAGGLTAGRVSPDTALFPYMPVDRIHESAPHTGSKTVLRVRSDSGTHTWEPFNREQPKRYSISRNLYKNVLGNKLRFEEINHDLQLSFAWTWTTSNEFGFVRRCELRNFGKQASRVDVLDGLQNILPASTPQTTQTIASNLVNAYKWNELDEATGLGVFTLYSGISDRAEPCESLKANTVFCLGLDGHSVLLSSQQIDDFRAGLDPHAEFHTRGIRGAYLVCATVELAPGQSGCWQIVANNEQSQAQIVELRARLRQRANVADAVASSVDRDSDELARIMAAADGFQALAEETVSTHHYANVLFNVLRGGIFDEQYTIAVSDLAGSVHHFNRDVYERNADFLEGLPQSFQSGDLISAVSDRGDPQLERLCYEYLPITFGRRHGDPSRPWNRFAIRLRDEHGKRLLSYEGNWRDIFQNWEALTFSYPEFIESVIAKFVNASTVDGYNPYRITKQGIDWEVEDPEDPWSYIGYWGDHQIIYLLKLLELSGQFHPARLNDLLRERIFSYANVPYRIRSFEALLENPKSTVDYDHDLAGRIEQRILDTGADGKLVLGPDGEVYLVTLLEKLLVPLLAKLGNLVIDGGIWLNTQRPEWNDANNAIVGNGLSVVTLCYMRRYVHFMQGLLADESHPITLSTEVRNWLGETAEALWSARPLLGESPVSAEQRFSALEQLGQAASRYRESVYRQEGFSGTVEVAPEQILSMLDDALATIDHTISTNRRGDGLYHAYNLLGITNGQANVSALYPMLEGQVAALSSGAVGAEESVSMLDALFQSDLYRPDQHTFMLYPDRKLPGYLEKNRIPAGDIGAFPLLVQMLDDGDERIVLKDADGTYRFNSDFRNVNDLVTRITGLRDEYGEELDGIREGLLGLYEKTFNHHAFTGRSGGMFGFEGLGCIYWHMVSKLLLAAQENFFAALDGGKDRPTLERLGKHYYCIRDGIGFNKTPSEYGAFPTDPYSHTPRHAGARQPGMTGQVKEEVLTRFGELGVRIRNGQASFEPSLLRGQEFGDKPRSFEYLDVDGEWQIIELPASALGFSWCQVPIVYQLDDGADLCMTLTYRSGKTEAFTSSLVSEADSAELFRRSGEIRKIVVQLPRAHLFDARTTGNA